MDLEKVKEKKKKELKGRVLRCRSSLIKLGVKNQVLNKFQRKFPEYDNRPILKNLWYGTTQDERFTIKLESFVEFKKNEY